MNTSSTPIGPGCHSCASFMEKALEPSEKWSKTCCQRTRPSPVTRSRPRTRAVTAQRSPCCEGLDWLGCFLGSGHKLRIRTRSALSGAGHLWHPVKAIDLVGIGRLHEQLRLDFRP